MPYIATHRRNRIDKGAIPAHPGELNYQLSQAVDQYLCAHTICYDTLNDVVGVLECLKQEVYRRIAAPYEDEKLNENGEVFLCLPQQGVVDD